MNNKTNMKKQFVIANDRQGIRWYKHVLTEFTVEQIIEKAIEISRQSPTTWANLDGTKRWGNIHWSFGNAFRSLYDTMRVKCRNNSMSSFNLDEVLTVEQIQYIATQLNVNEPYEDCWKRD